MSHAVVLVIGEAIEDQLAPYNENTETEPYKDYIDASVEEWPLSFVAKEAPDLDLTNATAVAAWLTARWGPDETYAADDQGIYTMSTYNPQSKWDYWRIGGRWAGRLLLKAPDQQRTPELSWEWKDASRDERIKLLDGRHVDQARKGELDWEGMQLERLTSIEKRWTGYLKVLDEQGDEAAKREAYWTFGLMQEELTLGRDAHLEREASLSPLAWVQACVAEGVWKEKGRMGWFGCSTDGPDERDQWGEWMTRFIGLMPDDVLLTICDYHI